MEEAFSDFSSIYYFTLRREKFEGTICNLAEFSQLQVNLTFSVSFSFLQQVQVNRSDKEAATTALRQQVIYKLPFILPRESVSFHGYDDRLRTSYVTNRQLRICNRTFRKNSSTNKKWSTVSLEIRKMHYSECTYTLLYSI